MNGGDTKIFAKDVDLSKASVKASVLHACHASAHIRDPMSPYFHHSCSVYRFLNIASVGRSFEVVY